VREGGRLAAGGPSKRLDPARKRGVALRCSARRATSPWKTAFGSAPRGFATLAAGLRRIPWARGERSSGYRCVDRPPAAPLAGNPCVHRLIPSRPATSHRRDGGSRARSAFLCLRGRRGSGDRRVSTRVGSRAGSGSATRARGKWGRRRESPVYRGADRASRRFCAAATDRAALRRRAARNPPGSEPGQPGGLHAY